MSWEVFSWGSLAFPKAWTMYSLDGCQCDPRPELDVRFRPTATVWKDTVPRSLSNSLHCPLWCTMPVLSCSSQVWFIVRDKISSPGASHYHAILLLFQNQWQNFFCHHFFNAGTQSLVQQWCLFNWSHGDQDKISSFFTPSSIIYFWCWLGYVTIKGAWAENLWRKNDINPLVLQLHWYGTVLYISVPEHDEFLKSAHHFAWPISCPNL